jgi:hypothetical protein
MKAPITHYLVAAAVVILVLVKFDRQTGFTGLIRFGETWQERRLEALQGLPVATVSAASGYDGQFYAQIALDPLLRSKDLATALDSPAYRSRRILVPTVAAVLGLGSPWASLQAYALLNLGCWLMLGWLLYRQIPPDEFGVSRWLGCMLSLGVLDSVRQALVDLPAALLLVLAVNSYGKSRPATASTWGALANLAKETSFVGLVALYFDDLGRPSRLRRAGLLLLASLLPLALWATYVHQRFAGLGEGTGFGNFTWPLAGLLTQAWTCLQKISVGVFDSRYWFGLIGIAGLVCQAVFLWKNRIPQSPWWRVGVAYSFLLLVLSSWVWSGYWAAFRAVLPMTIAFNLLLPRTRAFWPWWIVGNFTMVHAVWRFL